MTKQEYLLIAKTADTYTSGADDDWVQASCPLPDEGRADLDAVLKLSRSELKRYG